MEWYKCPHCIYNHPFEVTEEKPCPNRKVTDGLCRIVFNKGLSDILLPGTVTLLTPILVDKCPPEDMSTEVVVDTLEDKPRVIKDAAYWRERKRAQRASKKDGGVDGADRA